MLPQRTHTYATESSETRDQSVQRTRISDREYDTYDDTIPDVRLQPRNKTQGRPVGRTKASALFSSPCSHQKVTIVDLAEIQAIEDRGFVNELLLQR